LVKIKGYENENYDLSMLTTMFTDSNSISDSAKKYVAIALNKGLISGYEDSTFRGQSTITRAEAACLLWRAYQYGNGGNKTYEKEIIDTTPIPETSDEEEPDPAETDDEGLIGDSGLPIVKDITFKDYNIRLTKIGETYQTTLDIYDTMSQAARKAYRVTYKSSDESVVTIDKNGLITATGEGFTTVTLKVTGVECLVSDTASLSVIVELPEAEKEWEVRTLATGVELTKDLFTIPHGLRPIVTDGLNVYYIDSTRKNINKISPSGLVSTVYTVTSSDKMLGSMYYSYNFDDLYFIVGRGNLVYEFRSLNKDLISEWDDYDIKPIGYLSGVDSNGSPLIDDGNQCLYKDKQYKDNTKYNYNTNEWDEVNSIRGIPYFRDGYGYWVENNSDGELNFVKCGLDSTDVQKVVNLVKDTDIVDNKPLPKEIDVFCTDGENLYFYDFSCKCIRVVSKK
jgi:hypothetical protein